MGHRHAIAKALTEGDEMSDKVDPIEQEEKVITIIVNGRARQITVDELSFDELVDLAFDDPARGSQIVFTITFRKAGGRIEDGELDEGQRLKLRDGTVVNVTRTDQS